MTMSNFQQATVVLQTCGVVVLEGAYDAGPGGIIETLREKQSTLFQDALHLVNDSTVTVKAGKEGRYNQKVPHKEPFISSNYTENHILLSVLHEVMGGLQSDTIEIQTLSWVTSMPNR